MDQPDLFQYQAEQETRTPPVRHGPGRAVHPEVRRQRDEYIADALRSNWDVWVRLSDQDRVLWQAINAVKQQIKGTWTDEDEDEN